MALHTLPELVGDAGRRFGDAPALDDGIEQRTFAALAERVARIAGGFRERAVVAGDRIVLSASNSDALVETWLARFTRGHCRPRSIRRSRRPRCSTSSTM